MPALTYVLIGATVLYIAVMFALAFWARRHIHSDEDYIVAGRRLPWSVSTITILATWFGAGTLLVTADEVRLEGLWVTALEPLGPGLCLVITALFFVKPLWQAKLLTVNDYFRIRFGRRVELIANIYELSFLGWIAAQLLGFAQILRMFFGIPVPAGIVSLALVAMLYTLIGGMWSVAVTDVVQLVLLIVGLLLIAATLFTELGSGNAVTGVEKILATASPSDLTLIPTADLQEFFNWLSLFLAGTIGLIPSQDLMQRVFAARSVRTARGACVISGVLYITFGTLPVLLGLAGIHLDLDANQSVIPTLAERFLSPVMILVFYLTVLSTVLSTLDSALLAPSSVIAQNLLRPLCRREVTTRELVRWCVVGFTGASVGLALAGEDAFVLLESAYAPGLAPLVVLTFGIYQKQPHELAGLATLLAGILLWAIEVGWFVVTGESSPLPFPVIVLGTSVVVYVATDRWCRQRTK